MKYLYSVKGCSHCDNRGTCSDKNSEANLMAAVRRFENPTANGTKVWEAACKDFARNDSTETVESKRV